jgi:hypothetical protein
MPYVRCPRCGLRTFSAACWANVDHCERCAAELPRPKRRLASRFTAVSQPHQAPPVARAGAVGHAQRH